jgi:hypothetical protein
MFPHVSHHPALSYHHEAPLMTANNLPALERRRSECKTPGPLLNRDAGAALNDERATTKRPPVSRRRPFRY